MNTMEVVMRQPIGFESERQAVVYGVAAGLALLAVAFELCLYLGGWVR